MEPFGVHRNTGRFWLAPLADSKKFKAATRNETRKSFPGIFGRSLLYRPHGAHREIVLANSAAALVAAGRATDFLDGVRVATESIDSGAAREKLEAFIAFTQGEGDRATAGS